jgi:hypothetical protein
MTSNQEHKDPTLKLIRHMFIVLIIFIVFAWLVNRFYPCPTKFEIDSYYKPIYKGKIVKKYIKEMSHGSQLLDFKTKDSIVSYYIRSNNSIFEQASIGDSIFKEANNLDLKLKKANREVMFFPHICP